MKTKSDRGTELEERVLGFLDIYSKLCDVSYSFRVIFIFLPSLSFLCLIFLIRL